MSSHHFVKEGQEPALLVIHPVPFSMAASLLEWAPLVVVTEDALEEVLVWGIKIDIVVAKPARTAELQDRLIEQAPVKLMAAGDNLLDSSLMILCGMGESAVTVLCENFLPSMSALLELYGQRIQITVREEGRKWSFIESGSFKKWYECGSHLFFRDHTLADQVPNLKPANDGFELEVDQWIVIKAHGPFWLGEGI